jgi:hypothetical protein
MVRKIAILGVMAVVSTVLLAVAPAPAGAQLGGGGNPDGVPEDWQQYPFVCTTAREGLGQPEVDNEDGQGIPVVAEDPDNTYQGGHRYPNNNGYPIVDGPDDPDIVGWSRDCNADSIIEYRYRRNVPECQLPQNWTNTGLCWRNLGSTIPAELPEDMDYIRPIGQDEDVPYIVRHEKGVINRFIYGTAVLAPQDEITPMIPDNRLWNRRLVFHFGGGVGGGYYQGRLDYNALLYHQAIHLGYAVIYSSGTRSSTHYNLKVGGETAVMTKDHFVQVNGEPIYTIGVGGSGGGIQQYVYGQNHPGLLDGGVPQYAYPDMLTQTIHIGDCELMAHFFERTDSGNQRWRTIENRTLVEGMNAESAPRRIPQQWSLLVNVVFPLVGVPIPNLGPGSTTPLTECRSAWTGLTPALMNPGFAATSDLDKLHGYDLDQVEFTHWADGLDVYGVDPETGLARVPWSNVGVQYGLKAVWNGDLTPREFLNLNHHIGSWKDTDEQVIEGLPFICHPTRPFTQRTCTEADLFERVGSGDLADFDIWSSRNMNLASGAQPAPRRPADPIAIRNAHEQGHVFMGDIDIPMIDWRHYLEEHLDMHNTHQSFAARQRIVDAQGNHDNQLVWFTDARPEPGHDQTPEAFEVLHEWITNIQESPELGVGGNKPASAVDKCFDTDGNLLHAGDNVWRGILDNRRPGPCTRRFPTYTTSRIVAGAPITGDVFECSTNPQYRGQVRLIPVEQAAAQGFYGGWQPSPYQMDRLRAIFPDGVCDFGAGGHHRFIRDVPGRAQNVSAEGLNGRARVRWRPGTTGGAPITRFRVTTTDGEHRCVTNGRNTCVVRGLTNGTTYRFRVEARNRVGWGNPSSAASARPRKRPSSPQNISITPRARSIEVRWTRPASNGGAPIDRYRVVTEPGGARCATDRTGRTCTVFGLTSGATYQVRVQARNEAGWSPPRLRTVTLR